MACPVSRPPRSILSVVPDDTSIDRLLESVLPSLTLPDAVSRVAGTWRELLGAAEVLVGVLDRSEKELCAARANETGVEILSRRCAGVDTLRKRLAELFPDHEHETDVWVPFAAEGAVYGGALIRRPAERPAPVCPPEWITLTARLLTQVRELDYRLLQAKLASMAEFAAGAGHEINNPLGSILICAEKLLRDERDPERRRLLATIGGQAYRIRDMIGDAMLFARPPAPEREELDLAGLIRDVLTRFAAEFSARKVSVTANPTGPVTIFADRVQAAVVVSELLRNALQSVEDEGTVRVEVRNEEGAALLVVADNGRGLSAADREHLFDPFYSGRPAGRGLGFGLSKCWRIVTQHGGQIEVADEHAGGVRVTVKWPPGAG